MVLVDSDSDAMRMAVSHIQDTVPGARVVAVVADVGKEETASEVVAQTRKAFGQAITDLRIGARKHHQHILHSRD